MRYYGRKPRVYRKRSTVTKKRTYKKRSTVSNNIKRYVKRTIHSQIENKEQRFTASSQVVTSYQNNTSLLCFSMIPYTQISQGTGQGDRIGNKIRTMKCIFRMVLRNSGYSAAGNPIPIPQDVIVFFGKVKNSRSQQPIASDFAKLWQDGDSFRPPYSTTTDLIQDVNSNWFTVYKKVHVKVGYSIATGSGSNIAANFYANNDYKINQVRTIDLTKYCPKNVIFNDTTAQNTNDGLWMWAMSVNADGSLNNFDPQPCQMDFNVRYVYEDA